LVTAEAILNPKDRTVKGMKYYRGSRIDVDNLNNILMVLKEEQNYVE